MYSPVFSAIARLISLSLLLEPKAPESLPPCPGSITITQPFPDLFPAAEIEINETAVKRKNNIAVYILKVHSLPFLIPVLILS